MLHIMYVYCFRVKIHSRVVYLGCTEAHGCTRTKYNAHRVVKNVLMYMRF